MADMAIYEITAPIVAVHPDDHATLEVESLSHAIDNMMVLTEFGYALQDPSALFELVVTGIVASERLSLAVAPASLHPDPMIAAAQLAHAVDEAAAKAMRALENSRALIGGFFGRQSEMVAEALSFVC